MQLKTLPPFKFFKLKSLSFFSLIALIFSMAFGLQTICAQQPPAPTQLSLADILIGLRSKKATIDEKNKLLSDAARVRGITFALTPEIEKELENTGADKSLIAAIRSKAAIARVEPVSQPKVIDPAPPAAAPTLLPDFAAYQTSAREHFNKGEFDLAITDYGQAIELNPKDAVVYLNRGLAFYNQKKYELAVLDYDKAIELNPKNSNTYFKRGNSYEKLGDNLKAVGDYQKALELDANNESAKSSLQHLRALEEAKVLPKPKLPEPAPVAETPKIPETIELGQLNEVAVSLVKPVYPPMAQKSNIQGMVTVQLALDAEGKVTSAKAVNGQSMLRGAAEDAARRSKFKPAMFHDQAVKATGFITYNFKL